MSKEREESLTIETRLDFDKGVFECIERVLSFFAHLRGKVWRELIIKKESPNTLKSTLIREERVTARHANSLIKEVQAKASSIEELQKEQRLALSGRIKSTIRKIVSLDKKIKAERKKLKDIASYRLKVKTWRESVSSKPRKKPSMPPSIRHQFASECLKKTQRLKEIRHQKSRYLSILNSKMSELQTLKKASICFGGKALFNNQHHLEEAGFGSHEEWLETFRNRRSSNVFFIGSSDETFGNQSFQYDRLKKILKIRLPNAPEFAEYGKYLTIEGIEFPEYLRDAYFEALGAPSAPRSKSQKSGAPISYRLVRRVNGETKEKSYYVQANFLPKAPEMISNLSLGAVGVDINSDHLAITETDRFGNYVSSLSLPFDFSGKKSQQVKALIGDLSAVLIRGCELSGKALVMEDLDFSKKKTSLRELHVSQRKMLSSFAYAEIVETVKSRARKKGIEVLTINPAYTSLIGAFKYQGLHISAHKKAALAIARRGQGFSEGPEVHQGTLPLQAMIEEKARFQSSARHVWGFYADHSRKIRELLIASDKRPTQPSAKALSLAKEHPSLARSFRVILDRPDQVALHRVTG